MLPSADDIKRLCAVWLRPGTAEAAKTASLKQALSALLEVSGGSGFAVACRLGFVASGDLDVPGAPELCDGPEGAEVVGETRLFRVRNPATSVSVLFRSAEAGADSEAQLLSCGAFAEAAASFVGVETSSFGEWDLLGIIAEGGMARVYLARQRSDPSRLVAVKRIRPHLSKDAEYLSLFSREVQAATAITHPNVVRFIEFGVAQSEVYLAMEYLHGVTLNELTRRARAGLVEIPQPLLLSIAIDYCSGMHAIHRAGMVHCDVSPQNLFLTSTGEGKVIDFGLARARVQRRSEEREPLRGKRAYVAPEQLLGETFDQRADVFGLGAVIYELLSGLEPDAFERAARHGLPPLRVFAPSIPIDVEDAVMSALAPEPSARVLSAKALSHALTDAAREHGISPLPSEEVAGWMKDYLVDRDVALRGLLSPAPKRGGDETRRLSAEAPDDAQKIR